MRVHYPEFDRMYPPDSDFPPPHEVQAAWARTKIKFYSGDPKILNPLPNFIITPEWNRRIQDHTYAEDWT